MNQSGKVALGGIITALSTVAMFLTGLLAPVGTYALPAIAGVILIVIVIEIGARWAWMVYGAVSILSLLLAADKEAVLLFILFFGYYPILKANIERLRTKAIQWVIKMGVFNVAVILSFWIAMTVLQVPQDAFTIFGVYLPWVFLLAGNVVFVIYDYALTGVISMYVYQFHKVVKKMLHL